MEDWGLWRTGACRGLARVEELVRVTRGGRVRTIACGGLACVEDW